MTVIKQHVTDLFESVCTFVCKSAKPKLNFFHISCNKSQRCKSCGTNSKTFTGCSRCVSKTVENISSFPDFFRKTSHFSITTSVICNWPESISCQSYTKG